MRYALSDFERTAIKSMPPNKARRRSKADIGGASREFRALLVHILGTRG
jgi:hypothetical protein